MRAILHGSSGTETAVADLVLEGVPGEEVVQVLDRRRRDVRKGLLREKGLVRGDDHVRQRDEKRERLVLSSDVRPVFVEPFALLLVDVEPGRADRSVPERREKRLAVDEIGLVIVYDSLYS